MRMAGASKPKENLRAAKGTSDRSPETLLSKFPTIRKPWAHQMDALKKSIHTRDFAFFFEPGCGKTLASILAARFKMYQNSIPMRVLVLCPPIVVSNWKREWLEASPFKPHQIATLLGHNQKRCEVLDTTSPDIVITNYESLLMGPVLSRIQKWAPEIIIFDESHFIKSPTAKRTKVACDLAALPSVQHRFILSGTPILNSPMDLFCQYLAMDLGATFGFNFYEFRGTYFQDMNAGMPPKHHFPNFQIRPKALDAITEKMTENSLSVKKDDCLDLPPLLEVTIPIEMSPEQRKHYSEVAKDFITYMEGKACVAMMALTKGLRLMQIASGFIALEGDDGDDRTVRGFKTNPKDDALYALLEEITQSDAGAKVLIWASFRHNYGQIRAVCQRLDLPFVEVHGDIPDKQKFAAVDRFNTDPKIRVFIGHPGSGGIGINLTAAKYSVHYSRNFSLEHHLQSRARNYRGGSEVHDKITCYDLVMEGTIEQEIVLRLKQKQDIGESVLKGLALEMAAVIR